MNEWMNSPTKNCFGSEHNPEYRIDAVYAYCWSLKTKIPTRFCENKANACRQRGLEYRHERCADSDNPLLRNEIRWRLETVNVGIEQVLAIRSNHGSCEQQWHSDKRFRNPEIISGGAILIDVAIAVVASANRRNGRLKMEFAWRRKTHCCLSKTQSRAFAQAVYLLNRDIREGNSYFHKWVDTFPHTSRLGLLYIGIYIVHITAPRAFGIFWLSPYAVQMVPHLLAFLQVWPTHADNLNLTSRTVFIFGSLR